MVWIWNCRLAILPCFLYWLLHFIDYSVCHSETPRVLLMSFDGFRWDYLNLAKQQGYETPNFNRLVAGGVVIDNGGLKNTFVTKTLPNHFTLATGLYEDNHGIIANSFFDPEFNETFDIKGPTGEDRKWWDGMTGKGAEPIWITNDRPGGKRASGAYHWPSSIVDGQRPTYTRCYSDKMNFTYGVIAVDAIVKWFTDDVRPINLGLLYFPEPDHTGHMEGAASKKVMEKIVELDSILGYLIKSLEQQLLFDKMNIILTSDHGMANVTNIIYLDDFVDSNLYTQYGGSPVWNIRPNPGKEDEVYESLKKVPQLIVYRKNEIPKEFHYNNNRRIQPIVITVPEGLYLCKNRNASWCINIKGDHGYNNSLQSMHPIFIAHGPAFRKNYTSAPFNNVDVYPLMCHILRLHPHANDGDLENVKLILTENGHDDEDEGDFSITMISFLFAVGFTALVSGICCISACRSHRVYVRKSGQFFRRLDPNTLSMMEAESGNKQPLLVSEDEDFA